MLYMVFDVESIGLHGEGWAVGWVVVDDQGQELTAERVVCFLDNAVGSDAGRAWVQANCPMMEADVAHPMHVRAAFWAAWQAWKGKGAVLVADCSWPVEARFLAACVDDQPEAREWGGPYPLHDVATMRLAAGLDPLATVDRLPAELPQHDPLCDARQSARLWLEALHLLATRPQPTQATLEIEASA